MHKLLKLYKKYKNEKIRLKLIYDTQGSPFFQCPGQKSTLTFKQAQMISKPAHFPHCYTFSLVVCALVNSLIKLKNTYWEQWISYENFICANKEKKQKKIKQNSYCYSNWVFDWKTNWFNKKKIRLYNQAHACCNALDVVANRSHSNFLNSLNDLRWFSRLYACEIRIHR